MLRRISSFLCLGLFLTTSAWAQLASQTALVGTVTDSGNLVVPGAQVSAVNVGTKDTYEATTNSDDYVALDRVTRISARMRMTVVILGSNTDIARPRTAR